MTTYSGSHSISVQPRDSDSSMTITGSGARSTHAGSHGLLVGAKNSTTIVYNPDFLDEGPGYDVSLTYDTGYRYDEHFGFMGSYVESSAVSYEVIQKDSDILIASIE